MENKLFLSGSRALKINYRISDYDYIAIDDTNEVETFVNRRIDYNSHVYWYNPDYLDKCCRFELENTKDFIPILSPENYFAGLAKINPFDYKQNWINFLKSIDYSSEPYFWRFDINKNKKRFYHVVYNLYCLENNTFELTDESRSWIKKFHDKENTLEEALKVIERIQKL